MTTMVPVSPSLSNTSFGKMPQGVSNEIFSQNPPPLSSQHPHPPRLPRLRYLFRGNPRPRLPIQPLRRQARLNHSLKQQQSLVKTGSGTTSDTISYHKSSSSLNLMDCPNTLVSQTSPPYNSFQNKVGRWCLEIISCILSAICMVAIIVTLIFLKNERLPKWPLGLTLNAYISILSKVAGAALLLPTTEALGQLKWNWFQRGIPRRIIDFETFDDASRGPWGSFMLVLRTKGRSLASFGASITIFALALDPFFQQVVHFPERWSSIGGDSSVPRVISYEGTFYEAFKDGKRSAVQEEIIKSVAERFFYGNGTQPTRFRNIIRPEIPVFCPSSNCTWPQYESLGVCSACTDVSNILTFGCVSAPVDWIRNLTGGVESLPKYPNGTQCGYFLNITSEQPILMSGYLMESVRSDAGGADVGEALLMRALPLITNPTRWPLFGTGSIKYKHVANKIQDVIFASIIDGQVNSVYQNKTPVAHECMLAWCVRKYNSSSYLGNYEENIIDTYINNTSVYPYKFNSDARAVGFPENFTIKTPSGEVFEVSNSTAIRTVNVFDDIFPSFYTVNNSSDRPLLRYRTNGIEPRQRAFASNPWASPNNLTRHLERLATALTVAIRSSSSSETVLGQAFVMEPYVAVRWEWLSLPISLLFFSLIFLAATIWSSLSQQSIWKTSAIATLVHGLPDDIKKRMSSTQTGKSQFNAKELEVELQPEGWRAP